MITKRDIEMTLPDGYNPPVYITGLMKKVLRYSSKGTAYFDFGYYYYLSPLYTRMMCSKTPEKFVNHISWIISNLPDHLFEYVMDLSVDADCRFGVSLISDNKYREYRRHLAVKVRAIEREELEQETKDLSLCLPSRKRRL